jgi:hypothetical protein
MHLLLVNKLNQTLIPLLEREREVLLDWIHTLNIKQLDKWH